MIPHPSHHVARFLPLGLDADLDFPAMDLPGVHANAQYTARMSADLLGLEDKVALVVGGGRGGGLGMARQLARAGCHVAVADLDPEVLEPASAELRALGVRSLGCEVDATREGDHERCVAECVKGLGGLHVLVNNVGNYGGHAVTPVVEQELDFWRDAVALNLHTTFLGSRAAARHMIEAGEGGSIVNIASLSGLRAAPNLAPYGAVKAGVIHLTQSLALELAPHGLRVNCVAPPGIDGETLHENLSEDFIAEMAASIPLGRLCSVDDLGSAVLMLASELAAFVTGQTLCCDGGASVTTARASMRHGVERGG